MYSQSFLDAALDVDGTLLSLTAPEEIHYDTDIHTPSSVHYRAAVPN